MVVKNYDKLVRDLIPDIIAKAGKKAKTRIIDNGEIYADYLNKKLQEEFIEYMDSHALEELADIVEVIHALVEAKGLTWQEFEALRLEKLRKRGGFDRKIVLLSVQEE